MYRSIGINPKGREEVKNPIKLNQMCRDGGEWFSVFFFPFFLYELEGTREVPRISSN